jgi:hypothetical protein
MQVVHKINMCPVCTSTARDLVFELPNFPFTGVYVNAPNESHIRPDLDLLLCRKCGHGYLENIINPDLLYNSSYEHICSASPMSKSSNDFIFSLLSSRDKETKYKFTVEIGCDDLYLTRLLSSISESVVGVDPQWRNRSINTDLENISVIGKRLDELDLPTELHSKPDLIVAIHTLEHIPQPLNEFARLVDHAADDATIVVEVPCFNTQLDNLRFDQVFHQHVHYFSTFSMNVFIERLNCSLISFHLNRNFWGGTLVAVFKKGGKNPNTQCKIFKDDVLKSRAEFYETCNVTSKKLSSVKNKMYAWGASQILPCLAYHLKTDFSEFSAILDRNIDRSGKFFPDLTPQIITPNLVDDIEESVIFISAIDSARSILKDCIDRKPLSIIPSPFKF